MKNYFIKLLFKILNKLNKQLLTIQTKLIMSNLQNVKDALASLQNSISLKNTTDETIIANLSSQIGLSDADTADLISQISNIQANVDTTTTTTTVLVM